MSFFDVGGDIIGLAQLAGQFNQLGYYAPRFLENLIAHPTTRGHLTVLLASSAGEGGIAASASMLVTATIAAVATSSTLDAAETALVNDSGGGCSDPEMHRI